MAEATKVGFQLASSLASKHLTDAEFIKGGFFVVDTYANLTATGDNTKFYIANGEQDGTIVEGSLCYCTGDKKFYQYKDAAWVEADLGGGVTSYNDLTDKPIELSGSDYVIKDPAGENRVKVNGEGIVVDGTLEIDDKLSISSDDTGSSLTISDNDGNIIVSVDSSGIAAPNLYTPAIAGTELNFGDMTDGNVTINGTTVSANPTLSGSEAELASITIDGTKYKVQNIGENDDLKLNTITGNVGNFSGLLVSSLLSPSGTASEGKLEFNADTKIVAYGKSSGCSLDASNEIVVKKDLAAYIPTTGGNITGTLTCNELKLSDGDEGYITFHAAENGSFNVRLPSSGKTLLTHLNSTSGDLVADDDGAYSGEEIVTVSYIDNKRIPTLIAGNPVTFKLDAGGGCVSGWTICSVNSPTPPDTCIDFRLAGIRYCMVKATDGFNLNTPNSIDYTSSKITWGFITYQELLDRHMWYEYGDNYDDSLNSASDKISLLQATGYWLGVRSLNTVRSQTSPTYISGITVELKVYRAIGSGDELFIFWPVADSYGSTPKATSYMGTI